MIWFVLSMCFIVIVRRMYPVYQLSQAYKHPADDPLKATVIRRRAAGRQAFDCRARKMPKMVLPTSAKEAERREEELGGVQSPSFGRSYTQA